MPDPNDFKCEYCRWLDQCSEPAPSRGCCPDSQGRSGLVIVAPSGHRSPKRDDDAVGEAIKAAVDAGWPWWAVWEVVDDPDNGAVANLIAECRGVLVKQPKVKAPAKAKPAAKPAPKAPPSRLLRDLRGLLDECKDRAAAYRDEAARVASDYARGQRVGASRAFASLAEALEVRIGGAL